MWFSEVIHNLICNLDFYDIKNFKENQRRTKGKPKNVTNKLQTKNKRKINEKQKNKRRTNDEQTKNKPQTNEEQNKNNKRGSDFFHCLKFHCAQNRIEPVGGRDKKGA